MGNKAEQESEPTFGQKVANIQAKLSAPKNKRNDFNNFNYRNLEAILVAAKPLMDGLILTISDEMVMLGDRYYIKATATITDGDKHYSTTAYAREEENKKGMDSAQVSGSTSSYARKYAVAGLFLCDDNKDPDSMDNTKEPVKEDHQAIIEKWKKAGSVGKDNMWPTLSNEQQIAINKAHKAGQL